MGLGSLVSCVSILIDKVGPEDKRLDWTEGLPIFVLDIDLVIGITSTGCCNF